MRLYGLIGYPLAHSFSAKYFSEKFAKEGIAATYRLCEITSPEDCKVIEQVRRLDGFNVTSPYKEAVIPYMDSLNETALAVGAVNVVKREGERWIGYNTDCIGFQKDIQEFDDLPIGGVQALVLGTGGAAKAVVCALRNLDIPYTMVSRTHDKKCPGTQASPPAKMFDGKVVINYEALSKEMVEEHRLVINCTPLGMGECQNECPRIPYQWLSSRHFLYDCIYNPSETLFLRRGKEHGAHIRNGLGMLKQQAEAAWRIWS